VNLSALRSERARGRLGVAPERLGAIAASMLRDPELLLLAGLYPSAVHRPGNMSATPGAAAVLLIACLTDSPPDRQWHGAVMRHWHAEPYQRGYDPMFHALPTCPISGHRVFGRMLASALARPYLARRIVRVEVTRLTGLITAWYREVGDVARVYACTYIAMGVMPDQRAAALAELPSTAFIAVPGRALVDLAELLAGRRSRVEQAAAAKRSNPSGAAVSPAPDGIAPKMPGPSG
jgi:hypothetical protein